LLVLFFDARFISFVRCLIIFLDIEHDISHYAAQYLDGDVDLGGPTEDGIVPNLITRLEVKDPRFLLPVGTMTFGWKSDKEESSFTRAAWSISNAASKSLQAVGLLGWNPGPQPKRRRLNCVPPFKEREDDLSERGYFPLRLLGDIHDEKMALQGISSSTSTAATSTADETPTNADTNKMADTPSRPKKRSRRH